MNRLLLVVEDESPIREVVRAVLEDEGYRVVTVPDGQAALAALAAERYDLVLSDMMMPRLDGAGLVRAMHADPNHRDIPVILMSAATGGAVRDIPHAAFIAKPFDLDELLQTVVRVLAA